MQLFVFEYLKVINHVSQKISQVQPQEKNRGAFFEKEAGRDRVFIFIFFLRLLHRPRRKKAWTGSSSCNSIG
jgi:hypothetical protein